jgi:C1A family cysteine protease
MEATTLPASFDLRSSSPVGVTPVKDQVQCGSCWTFGSLASLESYFKYKKGTATDFSEADMNENHFGDWGVCMGGNATLSTAYLTRWAGPVTEADVPYPYWFTEGGGSVAPSAAEESTLGATPGVPTGYHVQNVYFLPQSAQPLTAADRIVWKTAIKANGAVAIAFHAPASQAERDNYYNDAKAAYYCNDTTSSNHIVAIVGWNDNFAKTNFKTRPRDNGAWIVKNSWGTSFGENGYFYMSYYDKSLQEGAQYSAEPASNYTRIYQYDNLGWVNSWGNGSTTSMWGANVFMASANARTIKAVGVYTPVPNSSYTIKVVSNLSAGPATGTVVATQTGKIAKPGYNTIKLTTPGVVAIGKPFSVVMKLTTPGYYYPIPVEYAASGYSTAGTACPGQSFYSSDGAEWYAAQWTDDDGTHDFNVCVKAYAVK